MNLNLTCKLSLSLSCLLLLAACSSPTRIGLHNGKLAYCPSSPNCVVSQSSYGAHYILPISYTISKEQAYEKIKNIILHQKRTKIIRANENYIHAEFRSMLGFVDDVEFYFPDNESIIHLRSASRVGYSDLGVNKKRMETIRGLFQSS